MFGRKKSTKIPWRQRWRTSKQIFGQAWALLKTQRDLWIFPIVATVLMMVFVGMPAGFVGAAMTDWLGAANIDSFWMPIIIMAVVLPFAYPFAIIMSLCMGAMSFALYERMEGRECSRGDAWRRAKTHLGAFAKFNLVAMLVSGVFQIIGLLLSNLRLVPYLGRVVELIGVWGWAAAAYFVIPIIVVQDERSAMGAIRQSVEIGKKHWGKAISGMITVGLVMIVPIMIFSLIWMVVAVPAAMLLGGGLGPQAFMVTMLVAMIPFVVVVLGASMVGQAAQVCYQTALYRFARTGKVSSPFTKESLADAWAAYRT